MVNFKNIDATNVGSALQANLQTNREQAELELNKWQNAQVCANITVRDNTNTVIGNCSPVFSRNLGTENTADFDFVDAQTPSGGLYSLQTVLRFDDTTQNVSILCSLTNIESISSVTFSISLFLIV